MSFDGYVNVILLISLLIIAIYYIYDKHFRLDNRSRSFKDIPGKEKTHPKFGNMLEFKECGSLLQFLVKLHKTYGDIATFYWEDTRVVSVCKPELFKCFQKLFDRPSIIFGNFKNFLGENSLQFSNGTEAMSRRTEYDKAFQHQSFIKYISDIEKVGIENLKNLDQSGSPIKSINNMCYNLSVKSVLKTLLLPSNKNEEFYEDILVTYTRIFNYLESCQTRGQVTNPNEEDMQFQKDKAYLYDIIKIVIKERRKIMESRDNVQEELMLIDRIILFHGEVDQDLIENEVMVFMIGGMHTTANCLAWSIYYLSKNPEYQEKLYEEIMSSEFRFTDTMECYKKILDLKYLRACIDETLRLSQVASYSARISSEDLHVKSYKIPANTPIILAFGVCFQLDTIFANSSKFDPGRFIRGELPSFSFTPFGFAGKRKCPGDRFSYLELSIWLIQLVKKYTFSLTNPDEIVDKVYGIVTKMDKEVSVNFQSR